MTKPTAINVAARAVALATGCAIAYRDMDCQAFIETCVGDCGGALQAAGSNDMLRNHAVWWGTLQNAKAEGRLIPGAGLLISEGDDESNLPAKYRGDGYGDFSHIGLYVGADALYDTDRNGVERLCDVVHSSSSMGRVAGSTLENGWTHVMWFKEIDYGTTVAPGVTLGTEAAGSGAASDPGDALACGALDADAVAELFAPVQYATVYARNGKPVKLRKRASSACPTYWNIPVGETVEVLKSGATWCKVRRNSRTGYMLTRFLRLEGCL